MYLSEELKIAINEGRNIAELREIAKKDGMVPLEQACRDYVLNGQTSLAEYMALTTN